MRKQVALALVVLYVMTLTALSLMNLGEIPDLGSSFDDKIYHFGAYALFTFILYNYFDAVSLRNSIFITAIIAVFYGAAIEIFQGLFTRSRTPDMYDLAANTAGIATAILIIKIYKKRKAKQSSTLK